MSIILIFTLTLNNIINVVLLVLDDKALDIFCFQNLFNAQLCLVYKIKTLFWIH